MTSVREANFDRLVERFLEAAALPELWPNVLQDIAETCGAELAVAIPVDGVQPLNLLMSRQGLGMVDREFREWQMPERNSRMSRSMALVARGWHGVITEQHVFTRDDLARDPFHQEFIVPRGFWSYAGAIVAAEAGMALPISLERTARQGTFSHQEIEQMNKLFAWLRPAGSLAMRLGMTVSSQVVEAFERVGQPAALLGYDGRVIRMNPLLETLLRRGRGLTLRNGRLVAQNADADSRLSAAIASCARRGEAIGCSAPPVIVPSPGRLRPLILQVDPVAGLAQDIFHLARVIVMVTDLERRPPLPSPVLLQQLFSLTPAEARLAAHVAAGESLADIAELEGCTRETIRSRLKDVFAKTGTRRQIDLALLLGKIAATQRSGGDPPPFGG